MAGERGSVDWEWEVVWVWEKKGRKEERREEEKKEIKERSEWGECVVGGKVGSSGETSCENFGVINYYFVCNFLKLLNFHVKIRVDDYDI